MVIIIIIIIITIIITIIIIKKNITRAVGDQNCLTVVCPPFLAFLVVEESATKPGLINILYQSWLLV